MTPPSRAAAQSISYARAVLDRAGTIADPCGDITKAADDLRDAIEIHDELAADRLSWESYDTGLASSLNPHASAVDASAKDAEELAWMLAEVTEKHLGPGAAEYVSNGMGEIKDAA